MSWGRLTKEQSSLLVPFILGKTVHDLGAGDLTLSKALISLGAGRVVAVEKDLDPIPKTIPSGIEVVHSLFRNFSDSIEIAFVSWPVVHETGLNGLTERSPLVIYLGKNYDGMSCGNRGFWRGVGKREILASVPDVRNTLILYGPERVERAPHPEEVAATDASAISYFRDLYSKA